MTHGQGPGSPPAGWYPDPSGRGERRYWDGSRWTEHYAGTPAEPQAAPGGPPAYVTAPAGAARLASPALYAVPAGIFLTWIGSAGKWVTAEVSVSGFSSSASQNGLDGDGWITLISALFAGILIAVWFVRRLRAAAIGAAVFGVISTLIAFIHVADPSVGESELGGTLEFSAGWGVWMALLGSLVFTAASVVLAVRPRSGA